MKLREADPQKPVERFCDECMSNEFVTATHVIDLRYTAANLCDDHLEQLHRILAATFYVRPGARPCECTHWQDDHHAAGFTAVTHAPTFPCKWCPCTDYVERKPREDASEANAQVEALLTAAMKGAI